MRNLIPAQEYFLADDITASYDVQPFIDVIKIDDTRDLGVSSRFSITTNILAKADRVEITFKNKPNSGIANFSLTKAFELDAKLGEQRISQAIFWEFTLEERNAVPNLRNATGTIATEKLMFDFKIFMVQNDIQETKQNIINQFKLNDTVLTVPYTYKDPEKNQTITKEDIDHSISSGDFVYYNANKNRWYPAEVSRSGFDKVVGLYLKNATEGTDFVFFNGIIEIDETWTITDSKNLVLRNLIPAQEYFLADENGRVTTHNFDTKSQGLAWLSKQKKIEVISEKAEREEGRVFINRKRSRQGMGRSR